MMSSLEFGDVFLYKQGEYIFLARTEDITYAAEILDSNKSSTLENYINGQIYKGKNISISPLYCYVKLTTPEYKDRCAKYYNSGKNNDSFDFEKLNIKIATKDLKAIHKEITESKFVSIELQNLISEYNF